MCPKFFDPHSQTSNAFQNSIYYLHISTHSCPAYFSSHLTRYTSQVNTRRSSPDNLYLRVPVYKPTVNKSKLHFHNCLSYDGPLLWNSLPHGVHSTPRVSCFRHFFRMHIRLFPRSQTFSVQGIWHRYLVWFCRALEFV